MRNAGAGDELGRRPAGSAGRFLRLIQPVDLCERVSGFFLVDFPTCGEKQQQQHRPSAGAVQHPGAHGAGALRAAGASGRPLRRVSPGLGLLGWCTWSGLEGDDWVKSNWTIESTGEEKQRFRKVHTDSSAAEAGRTALEMERAPHAA